MEPSEFDPGLHPEQYTTRAAVDADGQLWMVAYCTEQTRRLAPIIADVINHFNDKSKDYDDNARVLGTKGQFADIWRKIHKLKKAMWEEEELVGEQPEEILRDLIGHCFLALGMLEGKL